MLALLHQSFLEAPSKDKAAGGPGQKINTIHDKGLFVGRVVDIGSASARVSLHGGAEPWPQY